MLGETFIKRYIVEMTNKAETRPEELSQKKESCRQTLWNEIQLKGHIGRNRHTNTKKGVGKLAWLMLNVNWNTPTT